MTHGAGMVLGKGSDVGEGDPGRRQPQVVVGGFTSSPAADPGSQASGMRRKAAFPLGRPRSWGGGTTSRSTDPWAVGWARAGGDGHTQVRDFGGDAGTCHTHPSPPPD